MTEDETTDDQSVLNSSTKRRTFMGLLGGAAVSQMGTTSAAADEHSTLSTYDVTQTFQRLDSHVLGGYHEPTKETDKSHIAFVFMHPSVDFSTNWRNEIAERHGYRALGVDSHFSRRGAGQLVNGHAHDLMRDIGSAVSFLYEQPEVNYVILGGHSGGGHIMSLYQNIAENGVEIGQDAKKIYPLPDYLREQELPAADGLVLIDAHNGYAAKGLTDLGPQLVDPSTPNVRRPDVDMLNPDNGYNPEPDEPSSFTDEFLDRFFPAQVARMNALIEQNQITLQNIEGTTARFPDDEHFMLLDAYSRPYIADPCLLSKTQNEWPLHHAEDSEVSDESVTEEQIDSNRELDPQLYARNLTPPFEYNEWEVESITTRTFLSTRAIRATEDYRLTNDSFEGIEWNSANAQTPGNLETISVPLLITQATAFYFVTQGELFYNHAGMQDKTLRYVQGANHGFSPVEPRFGDTRSVVFRLWDQWITDRFV